MKPYYELDEDTKVIILDLLVTCRKHNLGNVDFHYFYSPKYPYVVDFYLSEYKNYWGLTVKHEKRDNTGILTDYRDIYKITDNEIVYQHSEYDIL
jgi:hypothetical protein